MSGKKPKAKPATAAPKGAEPSAEASEPKPVKVKGKATNSAKAAPPPENGEKTLAGFAKAELLLPTNPTAIVNNLLAREEQNPTGPVEPISRTVLTLGQLTKAMSSGEDIGGIKTDIVRIVAHQPEKADVFQSILNLIDQERVSDAVEIRAIVEKALKAAAKRGDLTTSECLAVWEIANSTIREYANRAAKQTKAVDGDVVVEKVDAETAEAERLIQERWAGTSPQGRQIIRMKLFDLKRQVVLDMEAQKDQPKEEEEKPKQPVIDVK